MAWSHIHNVCVVAPYAVRDHMRATGSLDLYGHAMSWSSNMHLCDWLLVHARGHVHASRVCLRVASHHWLSLRIAAHHRLLLRVPTHHRLLRVAAHWLLLRITLTHHRLLLRVAAHWLLLRISSHWLLLRVGSHRLLLGVAHRLLLGVTHRLLLRVAAHHRLLMSRLNCNCRANLSAGDLTISMHEHGLLHALRSMTKGSTTGFPNGPEMNYSSLFSVEEKLEPFIHTAADAQGGYLDFGRSDQIILARIIVPNRQMNVVSDVLDINSKHFTEPVWLLASSGESLGPDSLLPGLHNYIWVHLAECFGIVGESCLVDMNLKNSLSCHGFILTL